MAKVTIQSTDLISTSRTDINSNFTELYDNKIETSVLDTDTALTANSDSKIATQKAVKAYADSLVSPTGKSWNEYAVDAVGTDSYAITLTGFASYVAGQTFKFKAGTANTGACTLNVNGLGAKTIKKDVSSDLATGDILANQIVTVIYDGTNMQMVSNLNSSTPVVTTYDTAASPATWTKPTNLKWIKVELWAGGGGGGSYANAGGGGGGAYNTKIIDVASLGATETVTIGAGGARGNDGGKSSFGTHCEAYGGGKGSGASNSYGGGGGGQLSVGISEGAGGSPVGGAGGNVSVGGESYAGGGGSSNSSGTGGKSYYGGGGGGGYGGTGGASVYGGGGGGGESGGAGGTSIFGGAGGAGTGTGVAGSVPGGGGGGEAAGGNGRVIVYEFY